MAYQQGGNKRGGNNNNNNRFRRRKKKVCYFTENKVKTLDYKDVALVKKFINDKGKILPKRVTGTKTRYQRIVAQAVKRARHMALIPFVAEGK